MCTSAFAHGSSPISGQGRGRRQAAAGRTHGQGRGWPGALPSLCTALRPSASGAAVVGKLSRGERTGRGGVGLVHFRLCAQRFGTQAAWFGTARGGVRLCLRPPPPCARRRGTRCHNGANSFPERRGHFPGAADGRTIYYIRVRRREGENVLHRAASNNVDNPLWITAAAGGRLLCGGRGRRCGGSVNADGGSVNAGAEVQTQTGRVRKPSRAMGARRGVFRPHGRDFTAWTGRTYI